MKRFFLFSILLCGISVRANAAPVPVQRIDVINMLWNPTAGATGLTPTSVLLKFFPKSNSSTPCFTVTLPFEGSSTFFAGTGFACTTAVGSMSVTPVANPVLGTTAVYAPIASYTLVSAAAPSPGTDGGAFSTQLMIEQKAGTGSGTAPVFNTANGTLTTPGTAVVTEQDAL
jgi:hypothetical protein